MLEPKVESSPGHVDGGSPVEGPGGDRDWRPEHQHTPPHEQGDQGGEHGVSVHTLPPQPTEEEGEAAELYSDPPPVTPLGGEPVLEGRAVIDTPDFSGSAEDGDATEDPVDPVSTEPPSSPEDTDGGLVVHGTVEPQEQPSGEGADASDDTAGGVESGATPQDAEESTAEVVPAGVDTQSHSRGHDIHYGVDEQGEVLLNPDGTPMRTNADGKPLARQPSQFTATQEQADGTFHARDGLGNTVVDNEGNPVVVDEDGFPTGEPVPYEGIAYGADGKPLTSEEIKKKGIYEESYYGGEEPISDRASDIVYDEKGNPVYASGGNIGPNVVSPQANGAFYYNTGGIVQDHNVSAVVINGEVYTTNHNAWETSTDPDTGERVDTLKEGGQRDYLTDSDGEYITNPNGDRIAVSPWKKDNPISDQPGYFRESETSDGTTVAVDTETGKPVTDGDGNPVELDDMGFVSASYDTGYTGYAYDSNGEALGYDDATALEPGELTYDEDGNPRMVGEGGVKEPWKGWNPFTDPW